LAPPTPPGVKTFEKKFSTGNPPENVSWGGRHLSSEPFLMPLVKSRGKKEVATPAPAPPRRGRRAIFSSFTAFFVWGIPPGWVVVCRFSWSPPRVKNRSPKRDSSKIESLFGRREIGSFPPPPCAYPCPHFFFVAPVFFLFMLCSNVLRVYGWGGGRVSLTLFLPPPPPLSSPKKQCSRPTHPPLVPHHSPSDSSRYIVCADVFFFFSKKTPKKTPPVGSPIFFFPAVFSCFFFFFPFFFLYSPPVVFVFCLSPGGAFC